MNTLRTNQAPLLLCQVCCRWRRTAFSFPLLRKASGLQASCVVKQDEKFLTVHPSLSPILETWFACAGRRPLSLILGLNPVYEEESSGLTMKLEDVFNQLPISHLQHLSLSAFYPSHAYCLSKILREFMELESIFLNAQFSDIGFYPTPAPHRLLQSVPRLHSAELHNFILNPFPRYWILWSQLTHLRGERQLGEQVWYILICHCANLQHGIFSLDMPGTIHPPTIPISSHDIILPFLVDLTIHTC